MKDFKYHLEKYAENNGCHTDAIKILERIFIPTISEYKDLEKTREAFHLTRAALRRIFVNKEYQISNLKNEERVSLEAYRDAHEILEYLILKTFTIKEKNFEASNDDDETRVFKIDEFSVLWEI
ncbi:MAG: hypothetical protein P1V18_04255 [Candidatus Gracilibacteria bacterium]|nr:hypothetical protein [Candidatus Gracilibacteria bacterium]